MGFHIADYTIIRDTSFELRTSGDIDRSFDFNMQSGLVTNERAILFFRVNPEDSSRNMKFEITINGTKILTYGPIGTTARTLHEVVGSNVLRTSGNRIDFTISGGTGDIHFSDVVVLSQRHIQ